MTKNKSLRELEQIQQNLEYQNQELRVFVADILPKDLDEYVEDISFNIYKALSV